MATRTLAQLRTEVRQTADMENADAYLDNDEVDRYVNEAITELWDLLLEVHGQEWYLEEYTFTTTAGTAEYTIDDSETAAFYILKGVDIEIDENRYPLSPYNLLNRNLNGKGKPSWYRLKGNVNKDTGVYTKKIRLQPKPDSAYTIHLLYVPSAPTLDDDADVWDGHNGWEEYIVVTAAIRVRIKEESDTEQLELRKAQLEQRIRNLAGDRDFATTEIVTDTVTIGPTQGGPGYGNPLGGAPSVITHFVGGGSSSEPDPVLLWEWNGIDTSQFEDNDVYNGDGWNTSLTVVADSTRPGGNVLRYEWVSGGSGGYEAHRLIKESEVTLPLNYVVEIEDAGKSVSNRYSGWVFYADNTSSYHAYSRTWGGGGWGHRIDAGSLVIDSGTPWANLVSQFHEGVVRISIAGDKVSSVEPRFVTREMAVRLDFEEGGMARQSDYPSRPVPASWLTVSPTRAGIALGAAGGGTVFQWNIGAIRIYRHPKDR